MSREHDGYEKLGQNKERNDSWMLGASFDGAEQLRQEGIEFLPSEGAHIIIEVNGKSTFYWPSNQFWMCFGVREGRGIDSLINHLKGKQNAN